MSSPLGGFYLRAAQRQQKAKFDLSNRTQVQLKLSLYSGEDIVVKVCSEIYVGEPQQFKGREYSVEVLSSILASGLLNVVCTIFHHGIIGKQEFNLSPNEQISSIVEASGDLKLSVSAA
jgi:hypothetical protein